MHCPQGAVDREGRFGEQGRDGLKHVAALNAAVQVGVDVSDEAGLAAEVQQALHATIDAHVNASMARNGFELGQK